ncbi:hypothetical protein [Vibrio parahaemolyticus]|uniref:hypothetical protein n=1 Tax=Vibrio parahaemolyticus TaxID=670 RepID=UPI001CC29EBB|nr:hypothetical protein [Vibrio parahaemolyticus]
MVKAQSRNCRIGIQFQCEFTWSKSKSGIALTVDLFFGAATFGLTELNLFAEILLVEFVDTKADLLAEMAFSLVWKVHVVSVTLLKVRIVRLVFQKRFLVL